MRRLRIINCTGKWSWRVKITTFATSVLSLAGHLVAIVLLAEHLKLEANRPVLVFIFLEVLGGR